VEPTNEPTRIGTHGGDMNPLTKPAPIAAMHPPIEPENVDDKGFVSRLRSDSIVQINPAQKPAIPTTSGDDNFLINLFIYVFRR